MSDERDLYVRVHRLIDPFLRGDHAESRSEELVDFLREGDDAKQAYLDYVEDTVDLVWWGGQLHASRPVVDLLPRQQSAQNRLSIRVRSLAIRTIVAAACVGLVGFYYFFQHDRGSEKNQSVGARQSVVTNPVVATLVRTIDAKWRPVHPTPADFARLKKGNRIELASGQVELLFDSGVELVARGPCSLEIDSENSIIAERGSIFARVGESGRGFEVQTPATTLVDLGTEFGIEIAENGATDVAVFVGMVDISQREHAATKAERLFQGDAVRISEQGRTERLTAFDDVKFPTAGAQTLGPVRPPVIAEVRDNISDGHVKKAYRIVRRGLWEDSQAFVDRQHEWNGVDERGLPPALLGGEYVMPFNDDKFFADLNVVVDIVRPAMVYVLISNTVPVPEWLVEGFEDTGWSVGLDEGPFEWRPKQTTEKGPGRSIETVFSVWQRVVPAPQTLTLGGVIKHPQIDEGFNMYGIVAVPLDEVR